MKSKWVPLICMFLCFAIGWFGRGMYEFEPFRQVEPTEPAEQVEPIQDIVYPELPEGAINDLRGK